MRVLVAVVVAVVLAGCGGPEDCTPDHAGGSTWPDDRFPVGASILCECAPGVVVGMEYSGPGGCAPLEAACVEACATAPR